MIRNALLNFASALPFCLCAFCFSACSGPDSATVEATADLQSNSQPGTSDSGIGTLQDAEDQAPAESVNDVVQDVVQESVEEIVGEEAGAVDEGAATDYLRAMQFRAVDEGSADWIHWGDDPAKFSNWTYHSNRLIPVYTFGMNLDSVKGENSCYRSEEAITEIYGRLPEGTVNAEADYFDQTDIYDLQVDAFESGIKNVILFVVDGLDWDTTQAASIYRNKSVLYEEGRGSGLHVLDYRGAPTDFGFMVTSPHNSGTGADPGLQNVTNEGGTKQGGYSADFGGRTPWATPADPAYLLGNNRQLNHVVTDSAASATSMASGVKTYNSAINVLPDGVQVEPIAVEMQRQGLSIGVVSSVPISHATPAAAYGNNVSRNDYQDLSRDLLGLLSISHRDEALAGVDVLIGGGWGEIRNDPESVEVETGKQGDNYVPGNKYLAQADLEAIDVENGGAYVVAQRTPGQDGTDVLNDGVARALDGGHRLFGFFGSDGGHLPYQTADGDYHPTRGESQVDVYDAEDISENPTLAEMTGAALEVLSVNENGFWLMVESGDVDWALHNNNIDDAIGAAFSADEAFKVITDWVEENSSWEETVVIFTADHGHMMVLENPEALTGVASGYDGGR